MYCGPTQRSVPGTVWAGGSGGSECRRPGLGLAVTGTTEGTAAHGLAAGDVGPYTEARGSLWDSSGHWRLSGRSGTGDLWRIRVSTHIHLFITYVFFQYVQSTYYVPSPVATEMNKAQFLLTKSFLTRGVNTPLMKVSLRLEL